MRICHVNEDDEICGGLEEHPHCHCTHPSILGPRAGIGAATLPSGRHRSLTTPELPGLHRINRIPFVQTLNKCLGAILR